MSFSSSDFIKDQAFIGGEWVSACSRAVFDVINPADGKVVGIVPDMGKDDVRAAIDAADAAFADWRARTALERCDILRKWGDLITESAEKLASLMVLEQGKPFLEAKGEVLAGAATVRWCAEEGRRLYGEYIEGPKPGTHIVLSREPIGVVAAITPWNFPVGMITRKVGPALAAGCTIVLKPAESTPLCALALAVLAEEAGVPAGALNIVTTSKPAEFSEIVTGDMRVRKLSFTGSTAVGRILMTKAAQHIQKISLELGGNAPFIVFASADIERAVEGVIASKFRNAGQTCICANRIYVEHSIFDEFEARLAQQIRALKVGAGMEDGVAVGPLINSKAIEKVEKMVASAVSSGARLMTGGKKHALGGNFFEPTLITDVSDDQALAKEEIFGPVAALYSFKTEEEVVARANNTEYGLASYIYSRDSEQIWRVSGALQYGMVAVNEPFLANDLAPFGGVKSSGIGKEGGKYGLLEFTNLKYRIFG